MPHPASQDLIEAFADLAEHTRPACGSCRAPFVCCTGDQCEATRETARDLFGVDLPTGTGKIPFLAESGCTLDPYLRPICSVHVCEMHLIADTPYSRTYALLRERAEELLEDHVERAHLET
jgi:hypothetical protein